MGNENDQPNGLISVLLNRTYSAADRSDAAMDLGQYDEDRAFEALVSVALDVAEDSLVLEYCGESIADIWNRRRTCDPDLIERLAPPARAELEMLLDPEIPRRSPTYPN